MLRMLEIRLAFHDIACYHPVWNLLKYMSFYEFVFQRYTKLSSQTILPTETMTMLLGKKIQSNLY
jgi:hypothetical protein